MKEKLETVALLAVSIAAAVHCFLATQTTAAILFTIAAGVTLAGVTASLVFAATRRRRG